ncbi:MAG: FkbM family methyltransferase [Candidatus Nanopelagicales bacterium]
MAAAGWKVRAHRAAWRLGLDVLPVGPESREIDSLEGEDVVRLQGLVQRALGYSRDVASYEPPEWLPLVSDALRLAAEGHVPRAQILQDVWVLRQTAFAASGYFVEIGAADGYYLSNTWLLEHDYGWSGLLCEPSPVLARTARGRGRPRAVVDDRAVWSATGDRVELLLADERTTVVELGASDAHAAARRRAARGQDRVSVATVSPQDLLVEHGSPSWIDYLSVDTEGSEPLILRSFPWSDYGVGLLTVEHNHVPGRVDELDSILLPRGFRRELTSWSGYDAWYVHSDLSAPA